VLIWRRMRLLRNSVLLCALVVSATAAADLNGIWTGQAPGRHDAKDDIAFQFKVTTAGSITGKLYGDEVDLPIEEASLVDDKLKFSITTTNYYSGARVKFVYSGTITGDRIELTRERVLKPDEEHHSEEPTKHTFTLKRLVS
jgi:hypothetical protein